MEKAAFITGSASGLGKETALRFAGQGYRVFAGVRRVEDGKVLARLSSRITPVVLDVTNEAQIEAAAAFVDRECGERGLAVLVNMAGYTFYAPIEYTEQRDVVALFDTVAFGPYRLTNALLPALKRFSREGRERAKVLNIVSWAAIDASPFVGFYSAAKAALLRLTQAQFFELDRFHIDAIAVVPGLMKTPFVDRAPAQIRAAIARLPAQGRADYETHLEHMAALGASATRNPLVSEPSVVARKIVAISQKRRPKYQYNIGFDTKLVDFINYFLPFWLLRAMKRALFGLNRPLIADTSAGA